MLRVKLNRVYIVSAYCETGSWQPAFNPFPNTLSAAHEHVYAFLYHSESREKIWGSSVPQAKEHRKAGQRKVFDPPALGSWIRTTSRSISRTARADHTNGVPRHKSRPNTLSAREVRVSSYGSIYSICSGVKARFWRGLLNLSEVYPPRPKIRTV